MARKVRTKKSIFTKEKSKKFYDRKRQLLMLETNRIKVEQHSAPFILKNPLITLTVVRISIVERLCKGCINMDEKVVHRRAPRKIDYNKNSIRKQT